MDVGNGHLRVMRSPNYFKYVGFVQVFHEGATGSCATCRLRTLPCTEGDPLHILEGLYRAPA